MEGDKKPLPFVEGDPVLVRGEGGEEREERFSDCSSELSITEPWGRSRLGRKGRRGRGKGRNKRKETNEKERNVMKRKEKK